MTLSNIKHKTPHYGCLNVRTCLLRSNERCGTCTTMERGAEYKGEIPCVGRPTRYVPNRYYYCIRLCAASLAPLTAFLPCSRPTPATLLTVSTGCDARFAPVHRKRQSWLCQLRPTRHQSLTQVTTPAVTIAPHPLHLSIPIQGLQCGWE